MHISCKELLDILGTVQCRFKLKSKRDMILIFIEKHRTDMYLQHGSIIWPVSLNGSVFAYELSCFEFLCSCNHLIFRLRTCFEKEISWLSGNCRVWIQCEVCPWHNKNMQSKAPFRYLLTIQLNYLVSFAKVLRVSLRTNWLWVRDLLQSFKLQIWSLLWARISLTFCKLWSVDSLWNV